MDNLIKEQITFKISDIEKLFSEYNVIFEKAKKQTPDLFDITILGSVLHSFYNALENIFEIIAKNIDKNLPTGNKSHQQLLLQMTNGNEYRRKILNEELYLKLREYATFRHFFRHAYSFQLNFEKMEHLVFNVSDIWDEIKLSIENFCDEHRN